MTLRQLLTLSLTLALVTAQNSILHAATPNDPPKLLQGVHKIVTLGDSITAAGGQPGGYVDLLGKYLNKLYPAQNIAVVNSGIGGHKSTDMQARFQRDVLDHKPDLVTISVGVNDVWHAFRDFQRGVDHPDGELSAGVPIELYREKLISMINAAQAAKVKVVLLAPTLIYERLDSNENKRLHIYLDEMKRVASETRCTFVDLNKPFEEIIARYQKYAGRSANLLTSDGVHMNGAGNRIMAYTILRGLGVKDNQISDLKP